MSKILETFKAMWVLKFLIKKSVIVLIAGYGLEPVVCVKERGNERWIFFYIQNQTSTGCYERYRGACSVLLILPLLPLDKCGTFSHFC